MASAKKGDNVKLSRQLENVQMWMEFSHNSNHATVGAMLGMHCRPEHRKLDNDLTNLCKTAACMHESESQQNLRTKNIANQQELK